MRRVLQVFFGIVVVVAGVMLYNLLRDAQWAHSWFKSTLVMLPELGTLVAVFELHHSAKANELRAERNQLAEANNELEDARNNLIGENNELHRQLKELQEERSKHLAEIAKMIKRPDTPAERNAAKLRECIGSPVVVFNEDKSRWPSTPQIAEVSEGNIVALFQPLHQGSQASVVYADCAEIEIVEVAQGACPLQITVNKRYGNLIQLGEITRWEDRKTPRAAPTFERGEVVCDAEFKKPGSSETRRLTLFSSKDGANSFLLVTTTGEQPVGDNKAASIRFLTSQVEYQSEGFQRSGFRTGVAKYPVYVC